MKRTTNTALGFTLICASLLPSIGCLSDEEIEARRRFAFDLEGAYAEARAEGVQAGSIRIENQGDKNDVKATFTRGALYDGEQAFIDRLEREEDKALVAESLVFGDGSDRFIEPLVGGENVSTDFGGSSRLHVVAPSFPANAVAEGATEAKLEYRLELAIENGSDELKGSLIVEFSEMRPGAEEDDERERFTDRDVFAVTFQREAGPIEADRCDDCTGDGTDEQGDDLAADDAAAGDGAGADEGGASEGA